MGGRSPIALCGRGWLQGDETARVEPLGRPGCAVASACSGWQGLQGEAGWGGRATLWVVSPWFVGGRPCDCPGVPRARIRGCRVARLVSVIDDRDGGGLDAVHRVRRASRLLRGGDRGGGSGAAGGAGANGAGCA